MPKTKQQQKPPKIQKQKKKKKKWVEGISGGDERQVLERVKMA
jgi:hypothetical protein